jgi:hypothetical protein
VDPRQASPFAAAWTVACIRRLGAGGATSATFYETTGWLGLLEIEQGSRLPASFPSKPGAIFPVFEVFRDLAFSAGGELLASETTDPLVLDGLALRASGRTHVIVANLSTAAQRASVEPLPTGRYHVARLAGLTEDTPGDREQPESPRAPIYCEGGRIELDLQAYEVVAIDEEGRD